MNDKPLVSVVMITYNHEAYIEEAIQGVLIQNCDFDIEFIISNDNSTDRTAEVIKKVLREYDVPEYIRIKIYNHKINKGVSGNFIWTLEQAKGNYIAYCEGDDYWIDPLKLQKQVDFLEANNDFIMVFSDINTIDKDGGIKQRNALSSFKSVFKHEDFPFYCPSPTRLYRKNNFYKKLSNLELKGLDTFMLACIGRFGKIKFLPHVTSNYRVHDKGLWNSMNATNKYCEYINTHLTCLDYIDEKAHQKLFSQILKRLTRLKSISKFEYLNQKNIVKIKFKSKISTSIKNITVFNIIFLVIEMPFYSNQKFRIVNRLVKIVI